MLSPRFFTAWEYKCERKSSLIAPGLVGGGTGAWGGAVLSSSASLSPVATGFTIAGGAIVGAALTVLLAGGLAYFCCTRRSSNSVAPPVAQAGPPSPDHQSAPLPPQLPVPLAAHDLPASAAVSPAGVELRTIPGVAQATIVKPQAETVQPAHRNLHVVTNSTGSLEVPVIDIMRNSDSANAVPITPAAEGTHGRNGSVATPIRNSLASFGLPGFNTPSPAAVTYTYVTAPPSIMGQNVERQSTPRPAL